MGNICAESHGKFDIVCFGKPKTVSVEHPCPDIFVGMSPSRCAKNATPSKSPPIVTELRELGSTQYQGSRSM